MCYIVWMTQLCKWHNSYICLKATICVYIIMWQSLTHVTSISELLTFTSKHHSVRRKISLIIACQKRGRGLDPLKGDSGIKALFSFWWGLIREVQSEKMAVDDDNGQSVLFVAGYNHVIYFPNTYQVNCAIFSMFNHFLLSQVIMQRLQLSY